MENTGMNTVNKAKQENEATRQFLTFRVDHNEYGVDIMKVMEIRGWQEATRIPNSPEYMLGVINLRGLVIPIFDLRIRFSQGKTEATEKHVVIVVNVGSRTVGILVDSVSDILTVKESDIKDNPSSSETGLEEGYVSGLISHNDKMVIVLDADFLFDKKTLSDAESRIK